MTGLQYIKAALRLCGVMDSMETPKGEESDDALETLNRLLRHLALGIGPIFSEKLVTHTLTAGTLRYTIGSTTYDDDPAAYDDIISYRPQSILSAYIRSSNIDYPVKVIPYQEYQSFDDKATASGRPEYLAYNNSSPSGVIYLYPNPDAADSLRMIVQFPFREMTLSDTSNGDVDADGNDDPFTDAGKPNIDADIDYMFPPGYDEMLITNLAAELAIEYGVPMGRYNQIRQRAIDTKAAVVQSNFKVEDLILDPRLPNRRNSWNYRTGDYYGS